MEENILHIYLNVEEKNLKNFYPNAIFKETYN